MNALEKQCTLVAVCAAVIAIFLSAQNRNSRTEDAPEEVALSFWNDATTNWSFAGNARDIEADQFPRT